MPSEIIGDLPVKAGERTAGVGGGKKRMLSCNGADNPNGGSERMLTYRWSKTERMRCMMSKDNGTSTTLTGEKPIEREKFTWASVNWEQAETTVGRMQSRISKAYRDGKPSLAKRLSYLLVHSFSAKLLAVKRVSEQNKGKNTPGTDGVLWKSDKAKENAVLSLNQGKYRSRPLRRIYIPKKNGKMRPLSIPTMYDRAMQALYAMALDPIQEATADPNSYGFRKGRSCQDAMCQIQLMTNSAKKPDWVLEGDIKGCFDNFSHEWMLNNIPMDRKILKQFLKAGYVFEERLFPSETGSPQGGVISPILANMVLNGMEKLVCTIPKAHLIRFADDFVVTCPSKESAEKIKELIIPFLKERGLELSEEKTLITHIDDGFDFLGWNFRKLKVQKRRFLMIQPSKRSIESIKKTVYETILKHGLAMTQNELITILNPKLRGWCNYHCTAMSSKTFGEIDAYLFATLFRWGMRRHKDKGKWWVGDRYWHRQGKRKWVFCTEENTLFRPIDVKKKRYVKVRNTANPYLDREYFLKRQKFRKYERGYRDKSFAL